MPAIGGSLHHKCTAERTVGRIQQTSAARSREGIWIKLRLMNDDCQLDGNLANVLRV